MCNVLGIAKHLWFCPGFSSFHFEIRIVIVWGYGQVGSGVELGF